MGLAAGGGGAVCRTLHHMAHGLEAADTGSKKRREATMDWIGHIGIAYLIALATGLRDRRRLTVFVLGSILPDLYKLFYLLNLFMEEEAAFNAVLPLHMVGGVFLTSALAATLFQTDYRKNFALLLGGSLLHLFLDFLLWPWGKATFFFWPFTVETGFGFLWPDSPYPALIIGPLCVAAYLMTKNNEKAKK